MAQPRRAAAAGARAAGWARQLLAGEEDAQLLRRLRSRHGGSGPRTMVEGHEVVVFSSNDYLGLAADPRVRHAAADAAMTLGVGSTGSRHLSGCHDQIDALELELCGFERADAATLAPSGYQANVAALQALAGPDAVVLSDERNHASLIDGCRATRSRVQVYRHADLDDLDQRLRRVRNRAVIVSDSVFSMDADVADVAGLLELAHRHDAWLLLDEAHATGVLGPGGRGAAAEAGVDTRDQRLVRVVTLSKALGASGAAVLGDQLVRGLLLQRGRALIFSTAPPHPSVAAARMALRILGKEPQLVERLHAAARRLRGALADLDPPGRAEIPIVPVVVSSAERAVELEGLLLERGYLMQAVRPPTVPPGTSRIRLVASAAHLPAELDGAAAALRSALAGGP